LAHRDQQLAVSRQELTTREQELATSLKELAQEKDINCQLEVKNPRSTTDECHQRKLAI